MRSFPYIFAEFENLFLNWPQFTNNIMMISYRITFSKMICKIPFRYYCNVCDVKVGPNHLYAYLIHNDILQPEE